MKSFCKIDKVTPLFIKFAYQSKYWSFNADILIGLSLLIRVILLKNNYYLIQRDVQ